MRFKTKQKCNNCGNLHKNLHIYKGKLFLCWKCYGKKIVRIGIKIK